MNENKINISLIANAGVLVEYRGVRFLLDGIHYDSRHYFSKVPDILLEELLSGRGRFSNIDYLLFSHNHVDHFSPKHTIQYLKNNDVKSVYLPKDGEGKFQELKNFMQENGVIQKQLKMPIGSAYTYLVGGDMGITVFQCTHMGDQFADVENYCYLLTLGGKNILFTSDGDYKKEYYEEILKKAHIDVLFVNPLYLNTVEGRTVIMDTLKPERIIIYHIPFEEDDNVNFRKMVKKDMEKFKKELSPMTALWNKEQMIEL